MGPQIYVRRSPQSEASLDSDHGAQKWQISKGSGGVYPVWRRDEKELFFKFEAGIGAVGLTTIPDIQPGVPRLLFVPQFSVYGQMSNFLVTDDGQQFLILMPFDLESSPIKVVVNWPRALKF
jgi:hypothetical protein